jgi:bis(5'-nucleosidyl)-tetraphosphatase
VILYTGPAGEERFLLLHNPLHREWGFPKGHLEEGEDDVSGARRETREETGIEAFDLDPEFRVEIRYRVRRGTVHHPEEAGLEKQVVYFLGRSPGETHRLSSEHDRSGWFSARETLERLEHGNLREVARKALAHLRRAEAE